jgi:hypothetical protein
MISKLLVMRKPMEKASCSSVGRILLGNAIACLTPVPKCDLSLIKKTLDGKMAVINRLGKSKRETVHLRM